MTKKNILKISLAYIAYLVLLLFISGTCHSDWCRIQEDGIFGLILFTFAPLLPVFFLSLLTYRMQDEIFHAWWNFARWFVPVIIILTFLLSGGSSGGMGISGAVSGWFDALIIGFLYVIFIITSLVKIINARHAMKKKR